MSESKEIQPPSYEEAMFAYSEAPHGGFKYPAGDGMQTFTPCTLYTQGQTINAPVQENPSAPQHLPNPAFNQVPSYGAFETTTVNVITSAAVVPQEIIVIGGCPACRIGLLEDSYPCVGLLCAIAFFPLGVLCCLAMKNKRCSNCGTEF